MQRARKPASGQRRGRSKLVKEMEKLPAALERNAAHKRGHPFGQLVALRISLTVSSALCGACLSRCLIVSLLGVTMSRKLSLMQSAQTVR